jgi:hypothetical protein
MLADDDEVEEEEEEEDEGEKKEVKKLKFGAVGKNPSAVTGFLPDRCALDPRHEWVVLLLLLFREHLRNIQRTFREHSGNIQ